MIQDYSSHGVVFSKDLVNIAIVDDPGHAGKSPGLTFPGGRPKPKDRRDPLETFFREVRMEIGIPRSRIELLGTIRDARPVIIPGDEKKGIPPKEVLQFVYLARALVNGRADLKIPGETNGWFWALFDLRTPPEARGKRLYATYRNLWRDEKFLEMTTPLYFNSGQYSKWWEEWHKSRAAR